jgi:hypothetical protein
MNIILYYLDKFTAWLDFSWFITKKNSVIINDDYPPNYTPLVDDENKNINYDDPLLR